MGKIESLAEAIHKGLKSSRLTSYSTREMTSLDDLTHNYTEEHSMTFLFLKKYGQVFIGGRRYEV